MKPKKNVFLLCVVMLFLQAFMSGQNLSKKSILTFAEYLFESSDYSRASYEYLRVLHLFENSRMEKLQLYLKIGNCFSMLNRIDESQKYYKHCLEAKDNPEIYNRALINFGFLLFRQAQYRDSIFFLKNNKLSSENEKINTLILANYLCLEDKNKVKTRFADFKKEKKNYLKGLDQFMAAKIKLKSKSPLLAGLMSAIIPGTGRLYTGRVKEGLLSLISLAATSYLAYEGFRDKGIKSFKGWLFSSISVFLYIGNIHGAVVSAKLTNQMINKNYKKGVELSLKFYLND
jgi:TM2 domain-containing membrane protein YozV